MLVVLFFFLMWVGWGLGFRVKGFRATLLGDPKDLMIRSLGSWMLAFAGFLGLGLRDLECM